MDSVRVILGAVLIAISPIVGSAGTCSWRTDVTRGAWSSSGSWEEGRVPTASDSASFGNCTAGVTYTIELDGSAEAAELVSAGSGQTLVFTGGKDARLTAVDNFKQTASTNVFDRITWYGTGRDQNTSAPGEGLSYVFTNGATASLTFFVSRKKNGLYVGEDCDVTISSGGQEGGNKTIVVDNGTLHYGGFVGQNNGSATMNYVLRGKKARMIFTWADSYLNNSWKNVKFTFEIPVGGYDDVPVVLDTSKTKGPFMKFSNVSPLISSRFGSGEADCGLIFEVARESPVFTNRVERNVDQDLFRWNTEGWAFDAENANESKRYDLHDYTHLVRPERNLANRIIRRFDLVIRGTDEQEHPDAATLRKTGAVAYAVGYHLARDPGFAVIVTGPKTQRNRPSEQ